MRKRGFNRIVKTNFKHQANEFFGNSTLHGVRYIAEKGRSFGEKFMWFCFVAIGAVAAFVIIASLWEKFQTNPTITGLDTDFHDQQLEFPTVTICPLDPYNVTKVENFANDSVEVGGGDGYENGGEIDNMALIKVLTQLSYDNMDVAASFAKSNSKNIEYWNKKTLRDWVFDVAIECEGVFTSCKFRDEEMDCCNIFQPIYSERGFCYSFNARYFSDEASEKRNENFNFIFETDKAWSLELLLQIDSKIYINSFEEVFSYDYRPQFHWEDGNSIDLLISMKQTYTTDEAEQLTVAQRKCIFPKGSNLISYYKERFYSLSACMKECRMKNAIFHCKCIPPFYAPVNENAKKMKRCEIQDFVCLSKYATNITNIAKCSHCELSCFNTVYDIEKTSLTAVKDDIRGMARINIEFLTWPIIRYKREVLFGWVDLLVSFGGIAGLFLGFSLLSGAEIIYYFTVRASCMLYKNRKHLYEIQQEEDSRPPTIYDLSMSPKFLTSSQSNLTNIQMVQPVESNDIANENAVNVKALFIPTMMETRNRNRNRQDILRSTNNVEINKTNNFMLNNRGRVITSDKQISTQQLLRANNIFQPTYISPFARNIIPLDRNFRRARSEEPELLYHGYLP